MCKYFHNRSLFNYNIDNRFTLYAYDLVVGFVLRRVIMHPLTGDLSEMIITYKFVMHRRADTEGP